MRGGGLGDSIDLLRHFYLWGDLKLFFLRSPFMGLPMIFPFDDTKFYLDFYFSESVVARTRPVVCPCNPFLSLSGVGGFGCG